MKLPSLDPEQQREFAVDVVRKLRGRGFEAFWAGGCVRDRILGRTPKDYDVATTATPVEIRQVFGMRRTVAVGAAFGVITVVGPKTAGHVEVATFRQDAAYADGRHPDSVEFSTPEADARRRDFTINGLFYDPLDDRVIDYVGGQDDLARKILRAIGDPQVRFSEDKLRLLRAARFAAAFGFTLEPATRDAVRAMAPQITIVSAERIAAEMRLMLVHESRARAVVLLSEVGLLKAILPELTAANEPDTLTATGRPGEEAWSTALKVLETVSKPCFPLALAALLHTFVDSAGAAEICRRWKLSNHETHDTCWLIENQSALVGARQMAWPKLQRTLISAQIDELLALHEAMARAAGRDADDLEHCRELLKMPPEQLNPPPLLTGDDLIAHGVPRGKQYQRLLEAARDAQLEKRVLTKQEALALVDELQRKGS
ncbi:MAG TPA: CCA tRNA nucleotidyltransferase [Pirellulales bacterium]|nr:CCA tRNA nucleotidyltransferase [Pirellulales bacterium]